MKEFKNKKGIVCGTLGDDGAYRKRVVRGKHFMRVVGGYGIDESICTELQTLGCNQIRLKEQESGDIYSTSFENFMEHSKVADYGHGKQRFLSLKYFERTPEMV